MKIRAITYFVDPSFPLDEQKLNNAGDFLHIATPAFGAANFEVQSARLASVPFSNLLGDFDEGILVNYAQQLERTAINHGYAYVSMGPALPGQPEYYGFIPAALAETQNVFFSGMMTTPGGASLRAIHECAAVIQRASTISADGFANLRFAALANVSPGAPFFPAAYHGGGEPSFALAIEAADIAVAAFSQANTLREAQENLTSTIEMHAHRLMDIARQVELQSGTRFGGVDFSLAPFPSEGHSIGTAMERLGVAEVGYHGSLAAAAILTDALEQAKFQRAGFNGLFLPVLEDATLAKRAADGRLGITDLLLYSAVCGTGLDTIPLPGDTSTDQISAILLDLASLSLRLGKPFTARLMPIPGKKAGDPTEFDFPYFANSRILSTDAIALQNLLAGDESFPLHMRRVI